MRSSTQDLHDGPGALNQAAAFPRCGLTMRFDPGFGPASGMFLLSINTSGGYWPHSRRPGSADTLRSSSGI